MKLFRRLPIFVLVVLVSACASPDGADADGSLAEAQGTAQVKVERAKVPEFSRETLDGEVLTQEALSGKVTLVNFWATWCGPCIVETPELVALHNEWKDRKFEIIGVSMDEADLDVIQEFVDRFEVPYPILHDLGPLGEAFGGVYALPTTYIVNAQGEIQHRIIGQFRVDDFRSDLEKLLSDASGGEGT